MGLERLKQWRLTRPLRIVAAIALPVLVISVMASASTGDRYRFNTRIGPCYYHHIYTEQAPVDLLVLGGSSMMAAVDPDLLSSALSSEGRRGLNILNLASPWYGADAMAQLFDEFTARRKTTNVLVMIRFNGVTPYHRKGYFAWPLHDVLGGLSAPGLPLVERAGAVWRSTLKRLRDVVFVKHRAIDNYRRKPERVLSLFASSNTCLLDELADARRSERLHDATKRILTEGLKEADYDWQSAHPHNAYTLHYLRRIDTLARERGINLVTIRLPDLYEDVWSKQTVASLTDYLHAHVLDMPLHIRWELFDADGYRDERHLITPGREIFTPWLATELAPHLR